MVSEVQGEHRPRTTRLENRCKQTRELKRRKEATLSAMDGVLAAVTFQPKFLSRNLVMASKPTCIPIRARCEGISRDFVIGQIEPLKRSEVLELLSTALDTLLVPQNQKLLKERVENSKRLKAVSVGVSFPPQIVEPSPSEAKKEIPVEVRSSPPQFGEGLSAATEEGPREVNAAANYTSTRVLEMTSGTSIEESSLAPYVVQPVSSSGTSRESEATEEAESVHQGVHSMASTAETGVSSNDTSLSTMRRLKTLNVHSYVHTALRESFLRSHLRSRKIEE